MWIHLAREARRDSKSANVAKQLFDALPGHRIRQLRSDFGERLQDERSLPESRVWQREPGLVDDLLTIQNQIEVQRARCVPVGTLAPETLLDGQKRLQERA